jgi:hypothetical protein
LLERKGDLVTFVTKNGQIATLTGVELLRHFVKHVLPKRFVKIRHYGLYASSHVTTKLAGARVLLQRLVANPKSPVDAVTITISAPTVDLYRCPQCLIGALVATPLPAILDSS